MFRCPFLAYAQLATDVALYREGCCIREIMLPLQNSTQLHRRIQHGLVVRFEYLDIKIRWSIRGFMRRI